MSFLQIRHRRLARSIMLVGELGLAAEFLVSVEQALEPVRGLAELAVREGVVLLRGVAACEPPVSGSKVCGVEQKLWLASSSCCWLLVCCSC